MLQLTLPAWHEIQTRKMRTQSKSMKPPSRIFGRRKKNQILLFGTNTQNMFNTTLKQKKNAAVAPSTTNRETRIGKRRAFCKRCFFRERITLREQQTNTTAAKKSAPTTHNKIEMFYKIYISC